MTSYISDKQLRHLSARQALSQLDLRQLWRIASGTMRIDHNQDGDEMGSGFVRLALKGDLIGMEALSGMTDTISIRALTPVSLVPVVFFDDKHLMRLLMEAVVTGHQRCREMISLRTGTVDERVKRLLRMLADGEAGESGEELACALPSLGNMAEITNSTRETICRVLASLRDSQFLEDCNPNSLKRKHLENREHRLRVKPSADAISVMGM